MRARVEEREREHARAKEKEKGPSVRLVPAMGEHIAVSYFLCDVSTPRTTATEVKDVASSPVPNDSHSDNGGALRHRFWC